MHKKQNNSIIDIVKLGGDIMKNIRFVVDSTFGVKEDYIEKYKIEVVPLNVIIDDNTYLDGIDIPLYDVIDAVNEGKKVTTSQPSPGRYMETFDKLFSEGADQIIVLTISSALSGTIGSANTARINHPRSKDIFCHDTLAAHIQATMLLETAVNASLRGVEGEDIINIVKTNYRDSGVLMSLNDLNILTKSGRLSRISSFIGTILHVKPVVAYYHEKTEVIKKCRSSIKVYEFFRDFLLDLRSKCEGKLRIRLTHVNAIDRAEALKKILEEAFPDVEVEIGLEITAVLAIHIAYGGIGMGWIFERV